MADIASMIRSFSNDTLPYKGSPPEEYKPRLAVFGTSSDPPHRGHMTVVEMLVNSGDYDELWVLPVYVHMFSSKDKSLTPFDHRMAMCKLAFEGLSTDECSVKILPMEKLVCEAAAIVNDGKPVRVGSALILDIVHTLYPGTVGQTTFVLGSDTFLDLAAGKWKSAKSILTDNKIVVVERGMVHNGEGETIEKKCNVSDVGVDPISQAISTCTVIDPQDLQVSRFSSNGHLNVSSSLIRRLVGKLFNFSIRNAIKTSDDHLRQDGDIVSRAADEDGDEDEDEDEDGDEDHLRAAIHPQVLNYVFEKGLYVATDKKEVYDV